MSVSLASNIHVLEIHPIVEEYALDGYARYDEYEQPKNGVPILHRITAVVCSEIDFDSRIDLAGQLFSELGRALGYPDTPEGFDDFCEAAVEGDISEFEARLEPIEEDDVSDQLAAYFMFYQMFFDDWDFHNVPIVEVW